MTTDRELLELAAKAAGKDVIWKGGMHRGEPHEGLFDRSTGHVTIWNPLTDDGDALRLAVACSIAINPMVVDGMNRDQHETLAGNVKRWSHTRELHNGDPFAATRRAIVRAAAEMAGGAA